MYTLYGMQGSGSASTEAALALIGAPCRIVATASWERNAAFDELLRINPLGQIPTLVWPERLQLINPLLMKTFAIQHCTRLLCNQP